MKSLYEAAILWVKAAAFQRIKSEPATVTLKIAVDVSEVDAACARMEKLAGALSGRSWPSDPGKEEVAIIAALRAGLEAHHEAASSSILPRSEEWRIRINHDRFRFQRYVNGTVDESYREVGSGEATVWAAAIIQGFQPPRRLDDSDRPAG
jgi:hypothetical protein